MNTQQLKLEYGKRYVHRGLLSPTSPLVPNYKDGDRVYGFKDPDTGVSFNDYGHHHIHGIPHPFDLVGEYHEPPSLIPKPEPVPDFEPVPINPLLAPIDMGRRKKEKYIPKNPRKPKPETEPSIPFDVQPNEPEKVVPAIRICVKCHKLPCLHEERFCNKCRSSVLKAIKQNSDIKPDMRQYRSQDQRENTYETKHGTDY